MDSPDYHLAQVNIAKMRMPLEHPGMADFVARLDEINALAEAAPGFVWRLEPEEDNEEQMVAFERDGLLFNLSLWTSVEALRAFVYGGEHRNVMAGRGNWFEPMGTPHLALWWVPAGHRPGIDEALLRLDRLELVGPGPNAFTFAKSHPPPQRPRFEDEDDDIPRKAQG